MLTTDLLTQVREVAAVPDSVTSAELLRHADAEIQERLLPMLRLINEEYLVRTIDMTAENGRVRLPSRAMGAGVRLVQLVQGPLLRTLPRMDPAKDFGQVANGPPRGFYFDGGGIVLLPFGSSGMLRIRYYARPGKLVEVVQAQQITGVTLVGSNYQLNFSAAPAAGLHDIISSGPAHQQIGIDVTATNTNPSLVPASALLEVPQVGDWLTATPDTTPLVALPEELSSSVVLLTAARYQRARGYLEEAATTAAEAMSGLKAQLDLLRPRSNGNPKRLSGGTMVQLGSGRGAFTWWRW